MKKRSKMLLSLFLSAMMVFSVVPSTVLAETAPEETPAVQEILQKPCRITPIQMRQKIQQQKIL